MSLQQSEEDVSQFDTRFTRQTPVDSPDDTSLGHSAELAFAVRSTSTGRRSPLVYLVNLFCIHLADFALDPKVLVLCQNLTQRIYIYLYLYIFFYRVSPMWLHQSWKVWRRVSHLNPELEPCAVTTAVHAHPSGKTSRFVTNTTVHRLAVSTCPFKPYLIFIWSTLNGLQCFFFWTMSKLRIFQPSEFFCSRSLQGQR